MKLFYFAPNTVQLPRADSICIVQACEGFSRIKVNTTIISLYCRINKKDKPSANLNKLYNVKNVNFIILPSFTLKWPLHGFIQILSSIERLIRYSLFSLHLFRKFKKETAIFYVKNFSLLFSFYLLRKILSAHSIKLIFEIHNIIMWKPKLFFLRFADKIIANNEFIGKIIREKFPQARIIVVHQGIKSELLTDVKPHSYYREKLGIPLNKRIVVYTGKIAPKKKEIHNYIEVAKEFEDSNVLFYLVGGRSQNVEYFKKYIKKKGIRNIVFTGFVYAPLVYYYQRAADILLLCYDKTECNSLSPRSPTKLFEYMSACRPIITTPCPGVDEILKDGENALFVPFGDINALKKAIERLLNDNKLSRKLAQNARKLVENYTWEKRAQKIIEFVFD